MSWKAAFFIIFLLFAFIFFPLFVLLYYQYLSIAAPVKANIVIDVKKGIGPVPDRWKDLAQGGEEKGVRMLENVIPQISAIYPRYIRIDHIYDYYDVVSRTVNGGLVFNFDKLDATVCDIYRTGAKPFFSLGYMPSALSRDGSLVSQPKDWQEWQLLVQKTIERYSGKETKLCGQITDYWLTDIYYEVWNEPELGNFGGWSYNESNKSYSTLYFYSALGAIKATNVNHFFIGGPAMSFLSKNWTEGFLNNVIKNNMRLDFFSWHHYSPITSDFASQIVNLNSWLSDEKYAKFRNLPRIISEWGFDSEPNPLADTNIGAAHTVASIRNFFEQNIDEAFLFEIKDGQSPRWGILANNGEEKPRYKALKLLNLLEGDNLFVDGEGTYVNALASISLNKITVVLVNYDPKNLNNEIVPLKIINLQPGNYKIKTTYLTGATSIVSEVTLTGDSLDRQIIMTPNMVMAIELQKE